MRPLTCQASASSASAPAQMSHDTERRLVALRPITKARDALDVALVNATMRCDVLVVELDRGKVNALDLELLRAVIESVVAATPGQPIVLTGANRAFSAGVDLRRLVDESADYVTEFLGALSDCFLAIFDHPGPVVAAVNGAAIAGGCVIAAACDRRIIARGPIGLAELTVGVPFPTAGLEIVRGVLGSQTTNLVLSARNLEPNEALAIGLVDEVVRPDQLLPSAIACAASLAALPHEVFRLTKRQLQSPTRQRIVSRTSADDPAVVRLWKSEPVRAAVSNHLARLAIRSGKP